MIQSYSALYLLVGPGYSILKNWKKKGGPLLDRLVLKPNPAFERLQESICRDKVDHIIPIPQRYQRSVRLGRSPARSIALWLSRETGVPMFEPLGMVESGRRPQAELSRQERLNNKIIFKIKNEFKEKVGEKIILVDDFVTTGRTLRAGAQVLTGVGAKEVHAFCLGVRPVKIQDAKLVLPMYDTKPCSFDKNLI